jgi:hypothetical protein
LSNTTRALTRNPDRDLRIALGDVDARGALMNDIHHPAPSRTCGRLDGADREKDRKFWNLILVLEATIKVRVASFASS